MTVVYIVIPLVLIAVVLAAVWLDRWSVPVILVALGIGIAAGSDVLNVWYFDDVALSNDIANLALVFILFQGGLSTKRVDLQAVALPAGGLATWGVVLTAGALAFPQNQQTPVVVVALGIASFTYGGLLGVFFLGNFWDRARQRDALTGLTIALIVMAVIHGARRDS